MRNKPELSVNADQYPLLLQKLGLATGGQNTGGSDIEQLITSLSGPRLINSLTPLAHPESIGSSNGGLNSLLQNYQTTFGLVNQDAANSLAWAQQAQAKREAAEAAKRQAALQAKLLEAQKKAALAGLGGVGGGNGVSGGTGNYNLNPLPLLNPNKPTSNSKVKLPKAKSKPPKAMPPIVAPPKPKTNNPIEWAVYNALLAVANSVAKAGSNKKK